MKKNLGWIISVISICYFPAQAIALESHILPKHYDKEQGQWFDDRGYWKDNCNNNPDHRYHWNNENHECVCNSPLIGRTGPYGELICDGSSTSNKEQTKSTSEPKLIPPPNQGTSTKNEIIAQMTDIYSDVDFDGGEVVITNGEKDVQQVKQAGANGAYQNALRAWEQAVRDAENSGKFVGISKEDFQNKVQGGNELKWKIVELQKIIGFNHLRVREATEKNQVAKFIYQSLEYQKFWKYALDDNSFNGADSATAAVSAMATINSGNEQIGLYKIQLQDNYPSGWKLKYLNVPPKPTLEEFEMTTTTEKPVPYPTFNNNGGTDSLSDIMNTIQNNQKQVGNTENN